MQENTEAEVTETTEAPVAETSTPVETTESTEQDDSWETPLAFPTEAPTEDAEQVAEETSAPEVNESAEENTTDPPEVPAAEQEEEEEVLEAQADKPAPLSRRKLRDIEAKVISPFRDPDAPVKDVLNGLAEINPERTRELATELVHDAIQAYPNEWLEYLTGIEGVTLDTVKQKFSNEQPQTDAFQTVAQRLDELYGDSWKDASRDDELLDDDRIVAQALRDHLNTGTVVETEKDAQIKSLEEKLAKLQPEIETIKTQQEADFERFVVETKQKAQVEYQESVMNRVVPKLLDEHGLKATEQDAPIVKKAKEELAEKFKQQDGDMSDFEYFALKRFSGKDDLIKKIGRVEKYFDLAAKAEGEAKRERDPKRRDELQRTAEAYRADAKDEQDSFVVLSKQAGKEFLEKSSTMELLEQIAHLQTQLSQANFRPEIVGQAAIAGVTTTRDKILSSDDPWAIPLSEGLT